MSDTAIKVENLSKRYRIGLKEEMHDTLAGALTDFVTRPIRNLRRLRRLTTFEDGHRSSGMRVRLAFSVAADRSLLSRCAWSRRFCWWTSYWRRPGDVPGEMSGEVEDAIEKEVEAGPSAITRV